MTHSGSFSRNKQAAAAAAVHAVDPAAAKAAARAAALAARVERAKAAAKAAFEQQNPGSYVPPATAYREQQIEAREKGAPSTASRARIAAVREARAHRDLPGTSI
jgi:enoyl-CoA hydratase/carnithine racemase